MGSYGVLMGSYIDNILKYRPLNLETLKHRGLHFKLFN
jgi:hypothetical protein